jgi:hypothetical protein
MMTRSAARNLRQVCATDRLLTLGFKLVLGLALGLLPPVAGCGRAPVGLADAGAPTGSDGAASVGGAPGGESGGADVGPGGAAGSPGSAGAGAGDNAGAAGASGAAGSSGTAGSSGAAGGAGSSTDGVPGNCGAGVSTSTTPKTCPIKSQGSACAANAECATGFCTDGVCCNIACQGACVGCTLGGHHGTCWPVAVGVSDPRAICADQGAASCGRTGACDGVGSCQIYPLGAVCAPGSCLDGIELTARTCDGLGTCSPAASHSCAQLGCDPQTGSCAVSAT